MGEITITMTMTMKQKWLEVCASYRIDPNNIQYKVMFYMGALAFGSARDESNGCSLLNEIKGELDKCKEHSRQSKTVR